MQVLGNIKRLYKVTFCVLLLIILYLHFDTYLSPETTLSSTSSSASSLNKDVNNNASRLYWLNYAGTSAEGIGGQKIFATSIFMVAYLINRTVNVPTFSSFSLGYKLDELVPTPEQVLYIPFSYLYDVEHFQKAFLPDHLIVTETIPPHLEVTDILELKNYAQYPHHPVIHFNYATWTESVFKDPILLDIVDQNLNSLRELRLKIILNLIHSKWIRDVGDYITRSFLPDSGPFTCLHLRTEGDMKTHSHGPPSYYTLEQVIAKIKKSSDWFGLQIPILYVAGFHKDFQEIHDKLMATGLWSKIGFKDQVLSEGHVGRSGEGMPKSIPGLIDHEVCKRAAAFIGNCHSSWSELIFDYFSVMNRGEAVMMVNSPLEEEGLLPFCSSQMYLHYGRTDCRFP